MSNPLEAALRELLAKATNASDIYCTLDNEYARDSDPIELQFIDVDADDDGLPKDYGYTVCVMEDYERAADDARLILTAWRALPGLLDHIDTLTKERDEARKLCEDYESGWNAQKEAATAAEARCAKLASLLSQAHWTNSTLQALGVPDVE